MLNTEESRKGAMACLNALRIIERIGAGYYDPDSTMDNWWREIDAATVPEMPQPVSIGTQKTSVGRNMGRKTKRP